MGCDGAVVVCGGWRVVGGFVAVVASRVGSWLASLDTSEVEAPG